MAGIVMANNNLTIKVDDAAARAFRLALALTGDTMQAAMIDMIHEYIKKTGADKALQAADN